MHRADHEVGPAGDDEPAVGTETGPAVQPVDGPGAARRAQETARLRGQRILVVMDEAVATPHAQILFKSLSSCTGVEAYTCKVASGERVSTGGEAYVGVANRIAPSNEPACARCGPCTA